MNIIIQSSSLKGLTMAVISFIMKVLVVINSGLLSAVVRGLAVFAEV